MATTRHRSLVERGGRKALLKTLHTQKKCQEKPIFTNLKTRFEHIELPAKLLDCFLRSNKSNINQITQCVFDVALSPPRFPAHWLPSSSFLIQLLSCFGNCLLAAVWEDFFSIYSKRALLFVFFPRPATNHPILRLAHLFRPLFLLRFQ